MQDNKVRAIISFMIVGIFMIITGIMALYVYANDLAGVTDPEKTIEHLKSYSSMFTGIIGTIIGFYFGRSSKEKSES